MQRLLSNLSGVQDCYEYDGVPEECVGSEAPNKTFPCIKGTHYAVKILLELQTQIEWTESTE